MTRLIAIVAASSAVLSLAAWYGLAPKGRAAADADPWSVALCFEPEGQCAAAIVREIEMAEKEIRVHAYTMTTASPIPAALVDAEKRGVKVEVIADKTTPCGHGSAVPMLVEAAIPVWIDRVVPIAHQKTLIIDGETVVEGSYNFSGQAERNGEDLVILRSVGIADQYVQHWQRRRDVAEPYSPSTPCPKGRWS
jgi:phosphatidylserine/phosphatidylglycerophosphate/cardiolipin synthase-like enzyme